MTGLHPYKSKSIINAIEKVVFGNTSFQNKRQRKQRLPDRRRRREPTTWHLRDQTAVQSRRSAGTTAPDLAPQAAAPTDCTIVSHLHTCNNTMNHNNNNNNNNDDDDDSINNTIPSALSASNSGTNDAHRPSMWAPTSAASAALINFASVLGCRYCRTRRRSSAMRWSTLAM